MDTNEYRSQLPELGAFLEELELVLKNASKFSMPEVCWSANVLLSIDSGYDAPGVIIDIAKQMIPLAQRPHVPSVIRKIHRVGRTKQEIKKPSSLRGSFLDDVQILG